MTVKNIAGGQDLTREFDALLYRDNLESHLRETINPRTFQLHLANRDPITGLPLLLSEKEAAYQESETQRLAAHDQIKAAGVGKTDYQNEFKRCITGDSAHGVDPVLDAKKRNMWYSEMLQNYLKLDPNASDELKKAHKHLKTAEELKRSIGAARDGDQVTIFETIRSMDIPDPYLITAKTRADRGNVNGLVSIARQIADIQNGMARNIIANDPSVQTEINTAIDKQEQYVNAIANMYALE